MQQAATCPACDARLALPDPTVAADGSLSVECPICGGEFSLTPDRIGALPIARVQATPPPPAPQPPAAQTPTRDTPATETPVNNPEDPGPHTEAALPPKTAPPTQPEETPTPIKTGLEGRPDEPAPTVLPGIESAADGEQGPPLPTLAELLDRRPSTPVDPPPAEPPPASPKLIDPPPDQPDPVSSTANPPVPFVAGGPVDHQPTSSEPTPSKPPSHNFSFSFNGRGNRRLRDSDAMIDLLQSRPATGPSWKRGGLITAAGLGGVAAGFYLLTLLGGMPWQQAKPLAAAESPLAMAKQQDEAKPQNMMNEQVAEQVAERADEPRPFTESLASNSRSLADPEPATKSALELFVEATPPGVYGIAPTGPERQASFVEPTDDGRMRDERPAAADRPSALWAWLDDAPRLGVEQLTEAIDGAPEAARTLAQHSLKETSSLQQVGGGYAKLCEIAQVLSLIDSDASHPDMLPRRLEAEEVYRRLFRSNHVRSDSRKIAARWIAWPGRPHGGVFFSGLPEPARRVGGGLYEHDFRFEDGTTIKMVAPQPLPRQTEEVLVIGSVVDSPRARLTGYEGDAERVVWRAATISLQTPSLP